MAQDVTQQLVALLPRLRRFGYALCGSVDDGDDLVQAACERALTRLDQWQEGTRLDSWMFRIMQNLWIDQLRARKVRGQAVSPEVLDNVVSLDGRQVMEARLTLDAVRRAVDHLPPDQRIVLALVSVDGLSYKEAAATLDIPIGTVMSRLARARERVAAQVIDQPTAARARS